MSRPKATSQSFLPAFRCTGGEHAACSQPRDVGVIHCYWDVLWLSRGFWRFLHHLPVRQSAVSGWTPREHLCLSEHRLHAPASRGCFSVTPAAVPELLPLPKGLITRLVGCREGACLNCPRAAITKHQEAVK